MYAIGKEVENCCSCPCRKHCDELKLFIETKYRKLHTRATVFSVALQKLKGKVPIEFFSLARGILRLDRIEKKTRDLERSLVKWKRNEKPVVIPIVDLIAFSKSPKDDWEGTAIDLLVCTGLRPFELFGSASLKETKAGIEVSGLAKKRGEDPVLTERPVLWRSAADIEKMFHELRAALFAAFPELYASPGSLRSEITSNVVNDKVTSRVRVYLARQGFQFKLRDLRAVYAKLTYMMEKETNPAASYHCWISKVLGHQPKSLSSVLNYTGVHFV